MNVETEARRDPGAYWRDFAMQLPAGAAEAVTDLVGLPGSIYDIVSGSEEPSALSGENLGRGVDYVFGRPTTSGGRAARDTGNVLAFAHPGRAAPDAVSMAGRAFSRLGNTMNAVGLAAQPFMYEYRRGGRIGRG